MFWDPAEAGPTLELTPASHSPPVLSTFCQLFLHLSCNKLIFAFGWSSRVRTTALQPNALVSAARPPCRVTRDGTRMHGGRLAIGGLSSAGCRIWRGLRSRTRPAPTRAVSVRLLLGWTVGRSSAVACNGPASTRGCVVSCRGDQVRRCLCTVLDWIQICICAGRQVCKGARWR